MVHFDHLIRVALLLRQLCIDSVLFQLEFLKIEFKFRELLLSLGQLHHGVNVYHDWRLGLLNWLALKLNHSPLHADDRFMNFLLWHLHDFFNLCFLFKNLLDGLFWLFRLLNHLLDFLKLFFGLAGDLGYGLGLNYRWRLHHYRWYWFLRYLYQRTRIQLLLHLLLLLHHFLHLHVLFIDNFLLSINDSLKRLDLLLGQVKLLFVFKDELVVVHHLIRDSLR